MLSRRRFLRASLGSLPAAGTLPLTGLLGRVSIAPLTLASGALTPFAHADAQTAATITATDLGGIALLQGAGCNVLALPGPDGALLVDGGVAANADALLRAVTDATGNDRVATLVNTHWHPEQTGVNATVGSSGGTILAHEKTAMYLGNRVYAMAGDGELVPVEPLPETARPTEHVRGDGSLEFAGQRIDYGYLPAAHSDGDLYVHFPALDVLAAGGVVSAESWPMIDYRNGAWFGGRVRALEWLAELASPETRVIPADGRPMTGTEILRHRDIYRALFETLIGYMNRGFGPEDAAASDALAAYADEFGDPAEFLYGAYRSMLIAYVPD